MTRRVLEVRNFSTLPNALAALVRVILLFFALATSAHAVIPTAIQYRTLEWNDGIWHSTYGAACAYGVSFLARDTPSVPWTVKSCTADWLEVGRSDSPSSSTWMGIQKSAPQCPANSTAVTGGCECTSGMVESGGQCVDQNQACSAKAGKTGLTNMTLGWQRTPATSGYNEWLNPTRLPAGGVQSFCSGGCQVEVDAFSSENYDSSLGGGYVSQVPNSQGLYRVSMDFVSTGKGSACTATSADAPVNPNSQDDPKCPGAVGEINGTKVCVGTAEKPIRPEVQPEWVAKANKVAGNPAAGDKPETGEGSTSGGSGRTPAQGDGGSSGGPSNAAGVGSGGGGGGGSGAAPGYAEKKEGEEQKACGAPGQPKCSIDETGMPNAADAYKGTGDAWNQAKQQQDGFLSGLTNKSDKDTSWGVSSLSWLNHDTCRPWDLGTFTIMGQQKNIRVDICVIEPYVIGVMNFLWIVATFFMTISMVFRVMTRTGD